MTIKGFVSIALIAVLTTFGGLPTQGANLKSAFSTNGPLTVTYDSFPGEGNEWKFTVSKSDLFQPGDWVDFDILNSSGVSVDSDFEYVSSTGTPQSSLEFKVYVPSGVALLSGATIEINIDPGEYEVPESNYKIPMDMTVFPAAPSLTEYVKFSKPSYSIFRPQNCTYEAISLDVNDPYSEISSLDVYLLNASEKEIASDYVWIDREFNINFASLMLCPYDFPAGGSYKLVARVEWKSSGRAPIEVTSKALLSDFSENATKAVSKLKKFCIKGKTFKSTSTGKCSAGYKAVSFKTPTVKQWNSLVRNPSGSAKANFLVFACVAQFDSVTGASTFRAYSSRIESSSYYAESNSYFKGSSSQLLNYSEDDAIVANVSVIGKYTYTTFGGKTSVPYFQIRDIKKVGTC